MTQSLEVTRRLQAWHAGRPTPRGDAINVHVADDDDIHIVAFLRMGGESRPWGIASGTLSDGPSLHVVPEGRDRTLVGDMVTSWAPSFLEFFRHPDFSDDGPGASATEPLRQIWFPGDSHVEMLQHIAAAYARTKWERDDVDTLRAIGNLANCLFIESQRPGQQIVMSATSALRKAYVFPTAPVRQGHLGHLVAWLQGGNTRDKRLAAAMEAEKNSVATVVNPDAERQVLAPLLTTWNEARRSGDTAAMTHAAARMRVAMEEELLRRWNLTRDAIEVLRHDRRMPNSGLGALCEASRKSLHHGWGERAMNESAGLTPYWPNVFTDYAPRTAGAAYQRRVREDEEARLAVLHGDRQLQQEELARGRGLVCTVESVDATDGTWTLDVSYPSLPPCKVGDNLSIIGAPAWRLQVLEIDDDAGVLEVKPSWKREKKDYGSMGMAATSAQWVDRQLVLLTSTAPIATKEKKVLKRKENGTDIADLIIGRPRRHGAFTDDGVVIEVGDEQ